MPELLKCFLLRAGRFFPALKPGDEPRLSVGNDFFTRLVQHLLDLEVPRFHVGLILEQIKEGFIKRGRALVQ